MHTSNKFLKTSLHLALLEQLFLGGIKLLLYAYKTQTGNKQIRKKNILHLEQTHPYLKFFQSAFANPYPPSFQNRIWTTWRNL